MDINYWNFLFYHTDCLSGSGGPSATQLGLITFDQENTQINVSTEDFQWPNGGKIPLSKPKCGFDGLLCVTSTPSTLNTAKEDRQDDGKIGKFCAEGGKYLVFVTFFFFILKISEAF